MQDQMADIYDTSDDIQNSLARNSYNVPEIDEDQLEAEVEALGDEIVADNDTSYLDQATQAPAIPANPTRVEVPEPQAVPVPVRPNSVSFRNITPCSVHICSFIQCNNMYIYLLTASANSTGISHVTKIINIDVFLNPGRTSSG